MWLLSILFILFTAPFSYGEDSIAVYPQQGTIAFKGLDDTTSPLLVEDGRASSLQNVKLSRSYTLRKRDGYDLINNRVNEYINSEYFPSVTGLYYAKLSDQTKYRLVTCGRKIYYDNSGTWAEILGYYFTYNKNNQFVWITAYDNIIFSNDIDIIYKYTGSGYVEALDVSALSDTLTKVKCLAFFKNYLILANTVEGGTERPTRFRWSDVGEIESYQDDNYKDIAELGGQEIEAVIQLYDNLYFLLTDSIWKASLVGGDEIFVLTKVVDNVGCIAKNSVQVINLLNQSQGITFLSKDKRVWFFNGSNIVDLTLMIRGEMEDLSSDRLPYAVSSVDSGSYYLSVTEGSSATTNNVILEFQYEIGEWTILRDIHANAMASVVNDDNDTKVFFGNYDSFVYEFDPTMDNDVTGQSGGVDSVITYNLSDGTATGLTMLITDNTVDYSATGSLIKITSGSGSGEEKVIVDQTATGLIVDSAFSTDPDSSSLFEIGAIDTYYKTKWYDLGSPARRKLMGQIYLWAEEAGGVYIDIKQALDFSSDSNTESVSLEASGSLWGTAVWGVSTWGGQEALLKVIKLSGEGRFIRLTIEDNDIDDDFNLYNYNILYWNQDIQ
jgi:hypothetical protein